MATIDRFVEIVALGLSTHEAARAVKMGERSGDRYMARPDIKARVEEAQIGPFRLSDAASGHAQTHGQSRYLSPE